ncbi:hypothetical protein [Clostridium beijerinckii]|nr:hypothetical protein [Clostridium beijerinckii]MBA2884452.1 UDP-N-acetylglucosamine 2-epimerase [Clostridium beijerinckii]MBA2898178.1 UDP-N-acetylglucosamine 2-epimerase [Clostridium beijerinckii]MBA2910029.1 UDP-N-acetylglucosamine 2-epimerase [Clostridium beijerinckii]MBA9012880.1 UDP-N-acetylglucosamine 2-epimerase [Clostridium beijerinckii]MBC2416243.1 hypothetical protein [Clostridium beijerinckii]
MMLISLEEIYLVVKPSITLVYGSINSALTGSICVSKLLIPVGYIDMLLL